MEADSMSKATLCRSFDPNASPRTVAPKVGPEEVEETYDRMGWIEDMSSQAIKVMAMSREKVTS